MASFGSRPVSLSLLSSLVLSSLVSSTATATPVEARDLCTRSREFADQSVELDDELLRVSQVFSSAEVELGYRKDTHLKLILKTSCVEAVVARTAATEAMMTLSRGVPIHIEGMVHLADVRRRDRDYMGTDVDITVIGGSDLAALIAVKTMSMGPYRDVKGLTYTTLARPFSDADKNIDLRVRPTVDGFSFRRTVAPVDAELQATPTNTIKIVGLVAGAVVYVQRTAENLAFVSSLERGDVVVIEGRLASTSPSAERIFLVDAWRRKN